MRYGLFPRGDRPALCLRAGALLCGALLALPASSPAEEPVDEDGINAHLYQALALPESSGRIETVSGQMYLSQDNIDASVIREALSSMRALESGADTTVAVHRAPRINFEIHFAKNSALLTGVSRASLDELATVLSGDDYESMRFVIGGHTDQDGDVAINQPLSEARAQNERPPKHMRA